MITERPRFVTAKKKPHMLLVEGYIRILYFSIFLVGFSLQRLFHSRALHLLPATNATRRGCTSTQKAKKSRKLK
jgi:hypothetical protein